MSKVVVEASPIAATTVVTQLLLALERKGVLSRQEIDNLLMESYELQCDVPGVPRTKANADAQVVISHMMATLQNDGN